MKLINIRQGILHLHIASYWKPHEFLMLTKYARDSSSHKDLQKEETLFAVKGDTVGVNKNFTFH